MAFLIIFCFYHGPVLLWACTTQAISKVGCREHLVTTATINKNYLLWRLNICTGIFYNLSVHSFSSIFNRLNIKIKRCRRCIAYIFNVRDNYVQKMRSGCVLRNVNVIAHLFPLNDYSGYSIKLVPYGIKAASVD